jgi:hypothetical protein
MVSSTALRRQARVCERLADDSDDGQVAERLMALNLAAKADDFEELKAGAYGLRPGRPFQARKTGSAQAPTIRGLGYE